MSTPAPARDGILRLAPPPASTPATPPPWRRVLDIVGTAAVAFVLVPFALRNIQQQGDLRTYLAAGLAAVRGVDPYVADHLAAFVRGAVHPYVYPPVTLVLFASLAALPAKVAAATWIMAKVALLAGLVALWTRLVPRAGLLPIALVAVFGWNASALWDLNAGNVGIVEAALVWAGLACFIAGRRAAYAACIVAAALFKLLPAAFLLLALVPLDDGHDARRRRGLLIVSLAALFVLVYVPMVVGPAAHWAPFFAHVPAADTLGEGNPSMLGLLHALVPRFGAHGAMVPAAAWLAYAAAIAGTAAPLLRDAWRERDAKRWAMTAAFLYVLLAPRPMAYGFVLLTPAVLYFAPRPFHGRAGSVLLALVLSAQGMTRVGNHASTALAWTYAPCLLTLCVWLLVVAQAPRRAPVLTVRRAPVAAGGS